MSTYICAVVTEIVEVSLNAVNASLKDFDPSDLTELLESVAVKVDHDFEINNLPVGVVRVIHTSYIDTLLAEELEELQQEYVSCDGYGHHFSCDHEEYATGDGEWYIFRTK